MKKTRKQLKLELKKLIKKSRANREFNALLKSGEIQKRIDGFGNFQGYDDEAGHVYSSKEEVIDSLGLGEK